MLAGGGLYNATALRDICPEKICYDAAVSRTMIAIVKKYGADVQQKYPLACDDIRKRHTE